MTHTPILRCRAVGALISDSTHLENDYEENHTNRNSVYCVIPRSVAKKIVTDIRQSMSNILRKITINHRIDLPVGRIQNITIKDDDNYGMFFGGDGEQYKISGILMVDYTIEDPNFIEALRIIAITRLKTTDSWKQYTSSDGFVPTDLVRTTYTGDAVISPASTNTGDSDKDDAGGVKNVTNSSHNDNVKDVTAINELLALLSGVSLSQMVNDRSKITSMGLCKAGKRPGTITIDGSVEERSSGMIFAPDDSEWVRTPHMNVDNYVAMFAGLSTYKPAHVTKVSKDLKIHNIDHARLHYSADHEKDINETSVSLCVDDTPQSSDHQCQEFTLTNSGDQTNDSVTMSSASTTSVAPPITSGAGGGENDGNILNIRMPVKDVICSLIDELNQKRQDPTISAINQQHMQKLENSNQYRQEQHKRQYMDSNVSNMRCVQSACCVEGCTRGGTRASGGIIHHSYDDVHSGRAPSGCGDMMERANSAAANPHHHHHDYRCTHSAPPVAQDQYCNYPYRTQIAVPTRLQPQQHYADTGHSSRPTTANVDELSKLINSAVSDAMQSGKKQHTTKKSSTKNKKRISTKCPPKKKNKRDKNKKKTSNKHGDDSSDVSSGDESSSSGESDYDGTKTTSDKDDVSSDDGDRRNTKKMSYQKSKKRNQSGRKPTEFQIDTDSAKRLFDEWMKSRQGHSGIKVSNGEKSTTIGNIDKSNKKQKVSDDKGPNDKENNEPMDTSDHDSSLSLLNSKIKILLESMKKQEEQTNQQQKQQEESKQCSVSSAQKKVVTSDEVSNHAMDVTPSLEPSETTPPEGDNASTIGTTQNTGDGGAVTRSKSAATNGDAKKHYSLDDFEDSMTNGQIDPAKIRSRVFREMSIFS